MNYAFAVLAVRVPYIKAIGDSGVGTKMNRLLCSRSCSQLLKLESFGFAETDRHGVLVSHKHKLCGDAFMNAFHATIRDTAPALSSAQVRRCLMVWLPHLSDQNM